MSLENILTNDILKYINGFYIMTITKVINLYVRKVTGVFYGDKK